MTFSITQWHESERLINLVQSRPGRVGLWAVAMCLLAWLDSSLLLLAAVTLVMLFPQKKLVFLGLAGFGILLGLDLSMSALNSEVPLRFNGARVLTNATVLVFILFGVFLLALNFKSWPSLLRKFPIITLHLLIWVLLWMSSLPMLAVLIQVDFLAWRLSYMVQSASRGKIEGTTFRDHLFYLAPVFGGDNTPFGKGLDFLSRHEARDPEALARSQLAGIKLLVLALAWAYALELMRGVFFGMPNYWLTDWSLNLPTLAQAVLRDGGGPWYIGWTVIYLDLIRSVLSLAVMGHVVVGSLRLFGFNVFRNTYKPLLSESIVEFWNRYYYYFKELLVEFFFFPTYLRSRSLSPNVRLFLAVFAAAFVGNIYFHILAMPEFALNAGFVDFFTFWSSRIVYCFLLALGIWISMLRQQKSRQKGELPGGLARIRRIAGVWTFFALIQVWNFQTPENTIAERLNFLASLIGL